jgi:uncharacterized protein YjaG (DUF416 family)
MTYQGIISEFKLHAQTLSYSNRLRLIIAISKDLFSDYKSFSETYRWGNPDLLLDIIAISEQSLVAEIDITKIKKLTTELDAIIPDADDFGEYLGSYALNASEVVYEALQFILDGQLIHVIDAGTLYLDTIFLRIKEEGTVPETIVNDHPSMAKAREFLIQF